MPDRLRPLGVVILALLREGEMHPYEMLRLLRERRADRLVPLRNGTFYHQVSALERDAFIAPVGVCREGNRPERTTYAVLPKGRDAVAAWVRSRLPRTDRPDDFRVALAEAHNLDSAEVADLLAQRCQALRELRERATAALEDARGRAVDRQFLVGIERDLALAAADLAWTDAFRADLTTLHWGFPSAAHLAKKDHR